MGDHYYHGDDGTDDENNDDENNSISSLFDKVFGRNKTHEFEEPDESIASKWKLGDHRQRPSIDVDELKMEAMQQSGVDDDLKSVLEEAIDRLEHTRLSDYECPVCGLKHGHDDKKQTSGTSHDIRDSFNVTNNFANLMKFNACCHCSVHELAMWMDYYEDIQTRVFEDGDQFKSVKHLPSGSLKRIISEKRRLEEEREIGEEPVTVEDAIDAADINYSFSDEDYEALIAFHKRAAEIRSVAGSASVSDAVSNTIESMRDEAERSLETDGGLLSDAYSDPGDAHTGDAENDN